MNTSPRSIGAILCGAIFSIAWWIFIDGVVFGQTVGESEPFKWYYVFPGLGATVSLILLNFVNVKDALARVETDQDAYDNDEATVSSTRRTLVRAWLFIWLTGLFLCIAGGIWIMAAHYPDNWSGVAILIQPIIIAASAGLLLYVRK